jgi:hypothetical protein
MRIWVKKSTLLRSCVAFALFYAHVALAVNFHEHLYSLPTYDELVKSYEVLTSGRTFSTFHAPTPQEEASDDHLIWIRGIERSAPEKKSKIFTAFGQLYKQNARPITSFLKDFLDSDVIDAYRALESAPATSLTYEKQSEEEKDLNEKFFQEKFKDRTPREIYDEVKKVAAKHPLPARQPEIGKIPLKDLLKGDRLEALRTIYGDEVVLAYLKTFNLTAPAALTAPPMQRKELLPFRDFIKAKTEEQSLVEFARDMHTVMQSKRGKHVSVDDVIKSLFQLNPLNQHTAVTYQALEQIRKAFLDRIFEKKSSQGLEMLMLLANRSYIRSDGGSIGQDSRLFLSVPERYFSTIVWGFKKALSVQKVFYSVPRSQLVSMSDEKFLEDVAKVTGGLMEGWANGVDITGSINEERTSLTPELLERYEHRLTVLFALCGSFNQDVQIHMYEQGRSGTFYDAFFNVIEHMPKDPMSIEHIFKPGRKFFFPAPPNPQTIYIGHIAQMNREDIDRFKALQAKFGDHLRFRFQANLESNIVTQSIDIKKVAENIDQLIRAGLPVLLGSDGYGILGKSSGFVPTLKKLMQAGLPAESAFKLFYSNLFQDSFDAPTPEALLKEGKIEVAHRMVTSRLFYESTMSGVEQSFLTETLLPKLKDLEHVYNALQFQQVGFLASPKEAYDYEVQYLEHRMEIGAKNGRQQYFWLEPYFNFIEDRHIKIVGEEDMRERMRKLLSILNHHTQVLMIGMPSKGKNNRVRRMFLKELLHFAQTEKLKVHAGWGYWIAQSPREAELASQVEVEFRKQNMTFAFFPISKKEAKIRGEGGMKETIRKSFKDVLTFEGQSDAGAMSVGDCVAHTAAKSLGEQK